jgi:A/G-specific adenine glycosylase
VIVPARRRAALRERLLAWWDAGHRDLPWRFPQHAADPYRVWVAEVMLQQTQVATVVPHYERFVRRFPTLGALAAAPEGEVLALWSGLGYYARGRLLHAAARAAARRGGLPADAAALAALPGFGPYTAGAVASIAFARPSPCVDGNAARVLARAFLVEGAPDDRGTRERLWAIARELVPGSEGDRPARGPRGPRRSDDVRPGDFNQALMELGATICVKPVPRCGRCPIATACEARRAGREREIPPPRTRRAPGPLVMACAVVRRGGALLVARRPGAGLFAGLWGLPSAEVPAGEDPRAALREAAARLHRMALAPGEEVAALERRLTHRRLLMRAYACRARRVTTGEDLRFAVASDLDAIGLPTAMRALAEAVLPARSGRAKAPLAPGRNA